MSPLADLLTQVHRWIYVDLCEGAHKPLLPERVGHEMDKESEGLLLHEPDEQDWNSENFVTANFPKNNRKETAFIFLQI